jgi:hypothetical protein
MAAVGCGTFHMRRPGAGGGGPQRRAAGGAVATGARGPGSAGPRPSRLAVGADARRDRGGAGANLCGPFPAGAPGAGLGPGAGVAGGPGRGPDGRPSAGRGLGEAAVAAAGRRPGCPGSPPSPPRRLPNGQAREGPARRRSGRALGASFLEDHGFRWLDRMKTESRSASGGGSEERTIAPSRCRILGDGGQAYRAYFACEASVSGGSTVLYGWVR